MSHKIHPYGFRLGVIKPFKAEWFTLSKKQRKNWTIEDILITEKIEELLGSAGVADVFIRKDGSRVEVFVEVARPGVAIGPQGSNIKKLKKTLRSVVGKDKKIEIKIKNVRNYNSNATLVAQTVARGIEKRKPVKSLVKRALESIRKAGVQGAKITVSGRIGGIEQAMTYKRQFGRVPLHTLRADIDYAYERAQTTTAGILSVKVWIYKGDKLD